MFAVLNSQYHTASLEDETKQTKALEGVMAFFEEYTDVLGNSTTSEDEPLFAEGIIWRDKAINALVVCALVREWGLVSFWSFHSNFKCPRASII